MKKLFIISFLFFLFFIHGLYLTQFSIQILPDQLSPQNSQGFYDYRGQTHVHSSIGIGGLPPQEVIKSAQESNNDFIVFTDINDFTQNHSAEGYHDRTLGLIAGTYNYVDSRLILYDVLHKNSIDSFGQAQLVLADQLSQKNSDKSKQLVILAHPFKQGYSWSGPYPVGLDGIEVINLKVAWQKAWQNEKLSFIWSLLSYPFNPQLSLMRLYTEPKEELDLWDQISRQKKFLGFAGSDASAKTASIGNFNFRFPSYTSSFSLLSNHLLLDSELTGNFERDRLKVLSALKQGQFYMSIDIIANPKGFYTYITDEENNYMMGSEINYKKGLKLITHLPQKPIVDFEVAILKDSSIYKTINTQDSEIELKEKGTYRVIVRVIPTLPLPDAKKWFTWIYSNPFYLR